MFHFISSENQENKMKHWPELGKGISPQMILKIYQQLQLPPVDFWNWSNFKKNNDQKTSQKLSIFAMIRYPPLKILVPSNKKTFVILICCTKLTAKRTSFPSKSSLKIINEKKEKILSVTSLQHISRQCFVFYPFEHFAAFAERTLERIPS